MNEDELMHYGRLGMKWHKLFDLIDKYKDKSEYKQNSAADLRKKLYGR